MEPSTPLTVGSEEQGSPSERSPLRAAFVGLAAAVGLTVAPLVIEVDVRVVISSGYTEEDALTSFSGSDLADKSQARSTELRHLSGAFHFQRNHNSGATTGL